LQNKEIQNPDSNICSANIKAVFYITSRISENMQTSDRMIYLQESYLGDEEGDLAQSQATEVLNVGLKNGLAGCDDSLLVCGRGGAEGNVEGVDAALLGSSCQHYGNTAMFTMHCTIPEVQCNSSMHFKCKQHESIISFRNSAL
jgi:hypothetical protein